mgnify:CR=1 FL=1
MTRWSSLILILLLCYIQYLLHNIVSDFFSDFWKYCHIYTICSTCILIYDIFFFFFYGIIISDVFIFLFNVECLLFPTQKVSPFSLSLFFLFFFFATYYLDLVYPLVSCQDWVGHIKALYLGFLFCSFSNFTPQASVSFLSGKPSVKPLPKRRTLQSSALTAG